jgi:aspartate-semialdehyde dehydrogenase
LLRVGFIGWRGMVGSVLMQRMREENDFHGLRSIFFSQSNPGGQAPPEGGANAFLKDASNLDDLAACDVLISCQGGEYTSGVYGPLRKNGWGGYWIDAASTLRMEKDAIIILDPVNGDLIQKGLESGIRAFIGGNCTVSLMLMAVAGLLKSDLVDWITTMTYQAASGAGAAKMVELIEQMGHLVDSARSTPSENALELERSMASAQRSLTLPVEELGAPLAASLLPWIDREMPDGQSKEEWKGMAETNKILDLRPPVPVDGICVRVGTMRCHSQGLCIKLKRDVPLGEIESIISNSHEWVQLIPNDRESSLRSLTPAAVSGSLAVPIGRVHKLKLGPEFVGAFTVGDQLLWGAAEPLRRMLNMIRERSSAETSSHAREAPCSPESLKKSEPSLA